MPRFTALLAAVAVLALILPCRFTAGEVQYTLSLQDAHTQMIDVTMRVERLQQPHVDFLLPTWRPGRYSILDPAGTVREATASADDGSTLPIRKIDKSTWRVTTQGSPAVTIRYRVYANSLGDRTRHADDSHAFISPSSVCMYVPERRGEALSVRIDAPRDWAIASGLESAPHDTMTLVAPSYDVLVDSPIEVGGHDRHAFDVGGVPHEIIIWPAGIEHDADRMISDFSAIVEAQTAIFEHTPYERYVYLIHAAPGARGGTEHLNSTIMQTSRTSIEDSVDKGSGYTRFLGLVSHEMFHTWNVKQLRPAGIHPYDYQNENYTTLLWVAEGTTSYYDDLTMVRAGLTKPKKYLDAFAHNIENLRNRPGARIQSVAASSFDAWVKFNHSTPDDINSEVSFYSKGLLVSLLLDLEIRRLTDNDVSLDDVMRRLYEQFPLSGPGFTPGDLQSTIESMTDASFDGFFAEYVEGTTPLPFEDAMSIVGLELFFKPKEKKGDDEDDDEESEDEESEDEEPEKTMAPPSDRAYIGLNLTDSNGRTTVRSVASDGPAYTAGIIAGDEVIAMGGRRLRSSDLERRLERLSPGVRITLTIMRRDELREVVIGVEARPDGKWTVRKVKDPTDAQKAAFEDWCGQEW